MAEGTRNWKGWKIEKHERCRLNLKDVNIIQRRKQLERRWAAKKEMQLILFLTRMEICTDIFN